MEPQENYALLLRPLLGAAFRIVDKADGWHYLLPHNNIEEDDDENTLAKCLDLTRDELVDILLLCGLASYQKKGRMLKMADDSKWRLFFDSQNIETEGRYFDRTCYRSKDGKKINRLWIRLGSMERRWKQLEKYDYQDLEKNEKNKRQRVKSTTVFSPLIQMKLYRSKEGMARPR